MKYKQIDMRARVCVRVYANVNFAFKMCTNEYKQWNREIKLWMVAEKSTRNQSEENATVAYIFIELVQMSSAHKIIYQKSTQNLCWFRMMVNENGGSNLVETSSDRPEYW